MTQKIRVMHEIRCRIRDPGKRTPDIIAVNRSCCNYHRRRIQQRSIRKRLFGCTVGPNLRLDGAKKWNFESFVPPIAYHQYPGGNEQGAEKGLALNRAVDLKFS